MHSPQVSSWQEAGPGIFQQPHDSISMLFQNAIKNDDMLERQSYMMVTHCRVRFSLDPDQFEAKLSKAWQGLRRSNPGIACEWNENHRTYKVPTKTELARWMRESFQTPRQTLEETLGAIRNQFQPVLYFLRDAHDSRRADILLACNHAFSDGRGSYYLLDSLFKGLIDDAPDFTYGGEIHNLQPSRDELLGLPPFPSLKGWLKGAEMIRSGFVPSPGDMVLPTRAPSDSGPLPGGSIVNVTLTEEETAGLAKLCRQQGISVSAAAKAAVLMAAHACVSPKKDVFLGFDFYDTRPFMRQPVRTEHHPGQFYSAILPSRIQLGGRSFSEIAHQAHRHFKSMQSEMKSDPSGIDAVHCMLKDVFGGPGDAPATPFFSSIGVVDNFMSSKYGDMVDIESTWVVVPANGASNHNAWFSSCFKGKFQLTVTYSEAFYEKELIESIMHQAIKLMLKEACGKDLRVLSKTQFAGP